MFIVILSSFTFLGLGCKGLSPTQTAAITPVEINYWTVFDDVDVLRQFAEQYKVIRPYVTVNIRQVRYDDFDNRLINALADDIQPDIVSIHVQWLRKYLSRLDPMPSTVSVADVAVSGQYVKNVQVDVYDQRMPSVNAVKANYINTVYDDAVVGNRIYGLPLAVDTLAIYYNKRLLDRAGIATPPTTWDEFLSAVQKTTLFNSRGELIQSGVALGTADNIDNFADIFAMLLMQNGVEIANGNRVAFASGLEKRVDPNHPTMETLRFYTDFSQPTKEAYAWNDTQDGAIEAFTRGRSAFYIGYAFEAKDIRRLGRQIDWAVIPVPQLDLQKPVNVANYWLESVLEKSLHKDEAWDFIRFITSPENVDIYLAATGQPTPLRSQIGAQRDDPVVGPFVLEVLNAKNWYQGKDVAAAKNAFATLINDFREPFGEGDSTERDGSLILRAARTMQQTY